MLIYKPYFLILQGLIVLLFIILGVLKKEKKYFLFSSKIHFALYFICAVVVGYFFNKDYQLFCIPVMWTKILLLVYSAYLVFQWIFKNVLSEAINQIILGAGLYITLYIILFGSIEYLIWAGVQLLFIIPIFFISKFLNKKYKTRIFDVLNFYGATILLPYIIMIWTIWQGLGKKRVHKFSLLILPFLFILIGLSLTFRMNMLISEINKEENKVLKIETLIKNPTDKYLIELILGAHWKYHTVLCLYDGWRPPFHDPILSIPQLLIPFPKHFYYDKISLPERVKLYKKAFPENKRNFVCKCAKNERLDL